MQTDTQISCKHKLRSILAPLTRTPPLFLTYYVKGLNLHPKQKVTSNASAAIKQALALIK